MKLDVLAISLAEANNFVALWHRHHGLVVGHKFSLAVADDKNIKGVAIVGRPVSRMLDDGLTLEVTRVATDGTKDACSMLYGACRRACFALGYKRLVTYTLPTESGASLRGAGWKVIGAAGGGQWTRANRPRVESRNAQRKMRWEVSSDKPLGSVRP